MPEQLNKRHPRLSRPVRCAFGRQLPTGDDYQKVAAKPLRQPGRTEGMFEAMRRYSRPETVLEKIRRRVFDESPRVPQRSPVRPGRQRYASTAVGRGRQRDASTAVGRGRQRDASTAVGRGRQRDASTAELHGSPARRTTEGLAGPAAKESPASSPTAQPLQIVGQRRPGPRRGVLSIDTRADPARRGPGGVSYR